MLSPGAWMVIIIVGIVVYCFVIVPATAGLALAIGFFTDCREPMSVAFPLASIVIVGSMIYGVAKG
jgi:hypothetical protein